MTMIVVDRFSVTTDVWAMATNGERVRHVKGFRKIFRAHVINDTVASKLTPRNCIAFSGDAEKFYQWMVSITTSEPTVSLKQLIHNASEIGGEFRIVIPADEGVIHINNKHGVIAVQDHYFSETANIFVFGGLLQVPNHAMNASWFEPFIQAHNSGELQSPDVERFFYADGFVKKDRVLVDGEAKAFMKKRRRPWGCISHLNKRNK